MAKKPVTDPNILRRLEPVPETDPEVLSRLEPVSEPERTYPAGIEAMERPAPYPEQADASLSLGVQGDYSAPGVPSGDLYDPGNPGMTAADAYLRGLTADNVTLGTDPPEGAAEKYASSALGMAGMVQALAGPTRAATPALSALRFANPAAASGVLSFMGYGASRPAENLAGRVQHAADEGALGLGLTSAGMIPVVQALTRTPLGRALYDATLIGGMAKAQGASWSDAAITGAGAATGLLGVHGMGTIDPRRVPAERPMDQRRAVEGENPNSLSGREVVNVEADQRPVQAEPAVPESPRPAVVPTREAEAKKPGYREIVASMEGVATDPVPGVRATEPMSRLIKGEIDPLTYAAEYAAAADNMTGNLTDTHMLAGRRKVLVDRRARRLEERVKEGEMTDEAAAAALDEYAAKVDTRAAEGKIKPFKNSADEAEATRNALRASMPPELVAEIDAARVRDYAVRESVDPRRFFQGAGGQKLYSPIDRHIVRQNEMAERTTVEIEARGKTELDAIFNETGLGRSGRDYSNIGEMVKLVKAGETAQDVAAKPEYAEVAAKFKNPDAALEAAVRLRGVLERGGQAERTIHEAFGIEEPGYLEAYWPSTEKPIPALNIKGRLEAFRERAERGEQTRRIDPRPLMKQPNPRHIKKTGSIEREDMSGDVMYDWLVRHSRTLGHTPAIVNNDGIARYLEVSKDFGGAEYKNLPTAIRAFTGSKYGGKRFGLAGWEQGKAASSASWRAALEGAHAMKMAFNRSNYQFNPWFNTFTQWTSSFLGAARHPVAASQAIVDMMNPKIRALHDESYAGYMKRQPGGRITREGSVEDFGGARQARVNESMDRFGGAFSQKVERDAGAFSYALATRVGAARGWTPKEIDAFASDMIARNQSMYDNYNRAEILKSVLMNFGIPAQSYAVEVKNEVQNWFGGKYGNEPGTTKEGLRSAALYLGMFIAWESFKNEMFGQSRVDFGKFRGLKQAVSGEKDFRFRDVKEAAEGAAGLSSFVPYASSILGTDIGEGKMRPAQVYDDMKKAAENIADANDLYVAGDEGAASREMAMAYARMARLFMRGGAQQYKVIGTENMVDEGRVPESQRELGWIVGPYSTPAMAEERRRREGNADTGGPRAPAQRQRARSTRRPTQRRTR